MPKNMAAIPAWRDRVVDFRRIPARELQSHEGNWRTHSAFQQNALLGTLREVGMAGALLVYHSPAQDGALVTIDGHLRKALDSDQLWPCLVLDVDDAEAAYILATHDPVTALAQADTQALQALLSSVQSSEAGVQAMLSQLAEEQGIIPQDLRYDDHDTHGEEEYVPESPAPESNVRMVQLFLTNATYPDFEAQLKILSKEYQTSTITDTVLEAIRHATDFLANMP